MTDQRAGLVDNWLRHVRDVRSARAPCELEACTRSPARRPRWAS